LTKHGILVIIYKISQVEEKTISHETNLAT